MTRIESARAAADSVRENARESVRHAAHAAVPYAESARHAASHYAHEAGSRLGSTRLGSTRLPAMSAALQQARHACCCARDSCTARLSPHLDRARQATRQATGQALPRVEHLLTEAREAAGPAREEARARSTAALAALRGEVSPEEIEWLVHDRARRERRGRMFRRLGLAALVAGGAYAAWRWWDRQANPDWLIEPPEATEIGGRPAAGSPDPDAETGETGETREPGETGGDEEPR